MFVLQVAVKFTVQIKLSPLAVAGESFPRNAKSVSASRQFKVEKRVLLVKKNSNWKDRKHFIARRHVFGRPKCPSCVYRILWNCSSSRANLCEVRNANLDFDWSTMADELLRLLDDGHSVILDWFNVLLDRKRYKISNWIPKLLAFDFLLQRGKPRIRAQI